MRVDGDECRRSDAGVDGIPHETFAGASDDNIEEGLVGSETGGVKDGRGNGRRCG